MAGKGTLESNAILALTQTFIDQFMDQITPTPEMKSIIWEIKLQLANAWEQWPQNDLTWKDEHRIRTKLEAIANQLPMDRPVDLMEMISFILATLEDLAKKLKIHKKLAIDKLILSILRLHDYYADPNNNDFDHLLSGARAADSWQMEAIQ